MNEVLQQLYTRKSVRAFEETEISPQEKQAILQAAFEAPSAGNQQLYTILDITDSDLKQALSETCTSPSLPRPPWCSFSVQIARSGWMPFPHAAVRRAGPAPETFCLPRRTPALRRRMP